MRVVSSVNKEERVATHQSNLFIELDDSDDVKDTEQEENEENKQKDENSVDRAKSVHNANNLFDPYMHHKLKGNCGNEMIFTGVKPRYWSIGCCKKRRFYAG